MEEKRESAVNPYRISEIMEKLSDEDIEKIKAKIEKNKKILRDPKLNYKYLNRSKSQRIYKESLFGEQDETVVPLDRYRYPHEDVELARIREEHWEAVQQYKDLVDRGEGQNLVMTGGAGTGKTYLAKSLMLQLMKEDKKVLFLNALSLKNLAYKFGDPVAAAKMDRIKGYASISDLLILDDLGTESNGQSLTSTKEASQTIQSLIYELANRRTGKPTLITTNLDLLALKDIYQEQVISRLIPKDQEFILNFNALDDLRNGGVIDLDEY